MRYAGVLAGLLALGISAQDTKDKVLLRSKYKKGEKLTLKIEQKMTLTLEQIPDQFKETFGNKPLDLKITGTMDLEVKDVAEDGSAKLEGKFRTLNAKGKFLQNDVDYAYDSSKPQTDKGEGDDPEAPQGMDLAAMLRQLSTQAITFKVSDLGKVEIEGNLGQAGGGMASQLFSLNGLVGAFPKEKVGAGDKWNSTDSMTIPGVQFKVSLKSENTVEKIFADKAGQHAVVKSKATVATSESDSSSDQGSMFNLKAKFTGGGDGTTRFNVENGRPRNTENDLKVKITATMDDPQGGDPLEFKATIERVQKLELE